jgi:hypothetical protein
VETVDERAPISGSSTASLGADPAVGGIAMTATITATEYAHSFRMVGASRPWAVH